MTSHILHSKQYHSHLLCTLYSSTVIAIASDQGISKSSTFKRTVALNANCVRGIIYRSTNKDYSNSKQKSRISAETMNKEETHVDYENDEEEGGRVLIENQY